MKPVFIRDDSDGLDATGLSRVLPQIRPGKRTTDYADDTDEKRKSAPSVLSLVNSAAPTGRKKAIGHWSSAIEHSAKPPTALGQESQNTPSPEGAQEMRGLPSGWRWGRMAEQTRIVPEVERRLNMVEELETLVSVNLQRATHLRQFILQNAFTGGRTGRATRKDGLQVQRKRR